MKIVISKDKQGWWEWRVLARNGDCVVRSTVLYAQSGDAMREAKAFVRRLINAQAGGKLHFEVEEK